MAYLLVEGGQYVGPFKSHWDAERLILLMELCGENWTDAEVVEEDMIDLIAEEKERIR